MLEKRIAEIKEEMTQLRGMIATAKDEDLDGIQQRLDALVAEKKTIERKILIQKKAQREALSISDEEESDEADEEEESAKRSSHGSILDFAEDEEDTREKRAARKMEIRKRQGEDFKKGRTVVLDATVLVPKPQSTVLAGYPFNQVSSILQAVGTINIPNGETYDAPYIKGTGIGDYTDQPSKSGTDGMYHDVDLEWGTVQIIKTKITAYSEITKELERTPAAPYADAVESNITLSLRKKLALEVVIGDGETKHFTGIMSSKLNHGDTVVDYKLGEINENTLDEIILNYGGEEDIESRMALLLNKLTLLAFAKVRGTADKNKVYDIDYANQTIDGIRFFTSSAIKSFAAATAGTEGEGSEEKYGDAVMAYGDFSKYQIAIFSGIETARSTDYKFKQGITAFRGDVFMGGNIVGYKAFMRIFKGASTVKELTKINDQATLPIMMRMNTPLMGVPTSSTVKR